MDAYFFKFIKKKHIRVLGLVIGIILCSVKAQESLTLRKIIETNIISVGFRDGSIPFSYLDKNLRPIGYSMDICQRVVDDIKERFKLKNLEVKYRPVTSANRIPFVVNDIIDMECGTTTNTDERQKKVGFSLTTFVALSALAFKKTQEIRDVIDLKGLPVISTAGTTYSQALADLNRLRGLNMNIILGKDHSESFLQLETGRAVAFAMDDVILYGLIANAKKPEEYSVLYSGLSIEPYGIVLRKDDPKFKKLIDDVIVELFRSGEIYRIYDKWFQSPIPPNQINLRLPMSNALKKVIAHPIDVSDQAEYQ